MDIEELEKQHERAREEFHVSLNNLKEFISSEEYNGNEIQPKLRTLLENLHLAVENMNKVVAEFITQN